jgi:hypothetical protein
MIGKAEVKTNLASTDGQKSIKIAARPISRERKVTNRDQIRIMNAQGEWNIQYK